MIYDVDEWWYKATMRPSAATTSPSSAAASLARSIETSCCSNGPSTVVRRAGSLLDRNANAIAVRTWGDSSSSARGATIANFH
jgi:hypothetical protein